MRAKRMMVKVSIKTAEAQAAARLKRMRRRPIQDPYGHMFDPRCLDSGGHLTSTFVLFMLSNDSVDKIVSSQPRISSIIMLITSLNN